MATLTITVPDELAEQASTLGLLEPHSITALLREGIRRRHIGDLFDAADRLAAAELSPLSPEEIQAEIAAARAESLARRP
jgi:predicted N-formylglutamate amidohydrolase